MSQQEKFKERLIVLKAEHRDLDAAIEALSQTTIQDMLQLQRLKKRKLQIRDEITRLESELLPNIIA